MESAVEQFRAAESDAAALLVMLLHDPEQPAKLRCDIALTVIERLYGKAGVGELTPPTPPAVIVDDIPAQSGAYLRPVPVFVPTD